MKRSTPLKRTPFKNKASTEGLTQPRATIKTRKCKVCRTPFFPRSMTHKACSIECAQILTEKEKQKKAQREAAEHRKKLADSKPLPHWLALTERVVNHYIHVRDRGLPCISCGTRRTVQWEAGHYLSVGARPELRFEALNIHLQCHRCNELLSGNQAKYRIGLVEKIGEEAVQELEGPHPTAKFTREKLAEIRKTFSAMTRALEKERERKEELEPA